MDTNIWGPKAWIFLHTVTMNYPDNPSDLQRLNYRKFFDSLGDVLPCDVCNNNYKFHLKELPLKLGSRKELEEWLIQMHNKINKLHNKKTYTYNEAKEYLNYLFKQSYFTKKNIFIITILFVLISLYLANKFFNISMSRNK